MSSPGVLGPGLPTPISVCDKVACMGLKASSFLARFFCDQSVALLGPSRMSCSPDAYCEVLL